MELTKLQFAAFIASIIVPVYTSSTDTFPVIGAVNIATEHNFISQPYPDINGDRTTAALDTNFTQQCTSCDPGLMNEYCYYEEGICVKLSDTQLFYFSTDDGSLLYGSPITIGSDCTAKYLQKLSVTEFAIICQGSYRRFDFTGFPTPIDDSNSGEDGILVQLDSVDNIFHVEIVAGIVLTLHNLRDSTPLSFYVQACVEHTLLIHPLFSLSGLFIVSCLRNYEEERVYLMYSVDQNAPIVSLDLCGDPLSSPSHGNTFAVTCTNTVTVYKTDEVSIHNSVSFDTSITFRSYLDNTTLLVVAGTRHYILNVEIFMSSDGLYGIHTIDAINCTSPLKLIAPDVYAMSCHTGTQYSIHLTAISSGEVLAPVENLPEKPLDVYFRFDSMSPTPSSTIKTSTVADEMVSSIINHQPTTYIANMTTTSSLPQPTTTAAIPEPPSTRQSIWIIILPTAVACAILVFLIAVGVIWYFRSRNQIHSGVQETQETPLTCRSAAFSPTNTASVWQHGQV